MDSTPDIIINKYHDSLHDLNKQCVMVDKKSLNIVQWNVRGINDFRKFDELIYFVNECKFDIDVVVVGETWVKKENSIIYNIPGYRAYYSCRDHSSGGLAVFIRHSLEIQSTNSETINGLHYIHAVINQHGLQYNVIGVYRPPSFDYNEFQHILEGWLSAASPSRPLFIAGDVNIPINLQHNNIVI